MNFKKNWKSVVTGLVLGGSVLSAAVIVSSYDPDKPQRMAPAVARHPASVQLDSELQLQPQQQNHQEKTKTTHELKHNGGKQRLPLEASIDGLMEIEQKTLIERTLVLSSLDVIDELQIRIRGLDGQSSLSEQKISFNKLAAGELRSIPLNLPSANGSLVVEAAGKVAGQDYSIALEIKVRTPNGPFFKVQAADAMQIRDSQGELIQAVQVGHSTQN